MNIPLYILLKAYEIILFLVATSPICSGANPVDSPPGDLHLRFRKLRERGPGATSADLLQSQR
jgi:hypothetical protein